VGEMDGRINGTSKESYLKVAKDPEARASVQFDMMEHVVDKVNDLVLAFGGQPEKCGKKFVKVKHLKIAGIIVLSSLFFGGVIRLAVWLKLIPFL
jgi:hypothetical protein